MKRLTPTLDTVAPGLLMISSVILLTAGVLSYAPSAYGDWQTPEPTLAAGDPLFEGNPPPTGPLDSASPVPTERPGASGRGIATRIRIPSLEIDLPIVPSDLDVSGNVGFYPLCDVAMYTVTYVQPGEAGTTYIYAHAQRGMFAPLLLESRVNDGAAMVGSLVQVYTSDNRAHLYEITTVKRHATDMAITRIPAGEHQLVLQTSEGWHGHIPKLQVAARQIAVVDTGYDAAHLVARPRVCAPSE